MLFAHVITSVNSPCLLYAPVVTMVTSVSSRVPATCCTVNSASTSVRAVLTVTAHLWMDHVIVIQDILDPLVVQVCHDYICTELYSNYSIPSHVFF